jgi:hypothetical protein
MRTMRKMSHKGDEKVADYCETTTPERLAELEAEFNKYMEAGWFAADVTDGKSVLIKKFDPAADILLIPRVQGGCY